MRFRRKTSYAEDIRLFRFGGGLLFVVFALAQGAALLVAHRALGAEFAAGHALLILAGLGALYALLLRGARGAALWYGLALMGAMTLPFLVGPYFISQLTFVFVYAIAGIGLWVLLGLAGQISLGHAAFMAVGAYTAAILGARGYDLVVTLPAAILFSGALGVAVGIPALRMSGIYLAFATYAFAFIVEEVLTRYESLTGGAAGILLDSPRAFGFTFASEAEVYYLGFGAFLFALFAALNLRRSPTGRALIAIRDSEVAARSMGIDLAAFKTLAFALSAAFAGLAGALYAHLLYFISPEGFTIFLSIQLLALVVIGGLGSVHGAVLGAAFIVVLPQIIVALREGAGALAAGGALPEAAVSVLSLASAPGFESLVFGLVIVLMILYEPMGLYGLWMRFKTYTELFPLFRKDTFKRQKSYMVSERNR